MRITTTTRTTTTTSLLLLLLFFSCTFTTKAQQITSSPALPWATSPEAQGFDSDTLEGIKPQIDKLVQSQTIPGAVILGARNGELVLNITTGPDDVYSWANGEPIFRLFSMSKPIISILTLALVDAGKLSLDDSIGDHLHELANPGLYNGTDFFGNFLTVPTRCATVRELMTHSGGFSYGFNYKHPVDRAYILAGFGDMKDQISSDAFINKLKDIPLITKPGTTWRYGLNYDVLGVLLERAAQRPLDVLLAEYVTKPLQLADVAFYVPSYKASRLPPMDVDAGGDAPYNVQPMNEHYDPPFKSGGAGLYASASDYLRIGQMLVNGGELDGVRILSEESVGEMMRNQLPFTELPYQMGGFYGHAFGLGVDVCTPDEASPGRPEGEVSWGGYAQTQWFISGGPNVKGTENDKQTVLVLMSQHAPINDKLTKVVKPAFYEALRLGSSSKKSGANEKKKTAGAAAATTAAAAKHSFLRQGPRMGGRE